MHKMARYLLRLAPVLAAAAAASRSAHIVHLCSEDHRAAVGAEWPDAHHITMPDAVPGRRRVRLPVELRADAAARGRAEVQRQLRADVPADRVRGPAARGRADAPRQLLRVSRPSTTTSPSPALRFDSPSLTSSSRQSHPAVSIKTVAEWPASHEASSPSTPDKT